MHTDPPKALYDLSTAVSTYTFPSNFEGRCLPLAFLLPKKWCVRSYPTRWGTLRFP